MIKALVQWQTTNTIHTITLPVTAATEAQRTQRAQSGASD